MGRAAEPADFPQAELTPDFQYYADDDEDGFTGNPDEIEDVEIPTPEAQDNYVGGSLELPFGDGLAQGKVTNRARDNDGNVIGRAHDNPILDTRRYVVAFKNGEEAELSANAIAQSMYAQCDPQSIHYLPPRFVKYTSIVINQVYSLLHLLILCLICTLWGTYPLHGII